MYINNRGDRRFPTGINFDDFSQKDIIPVGFVMFYFEKNMPYKFKKLIDLEDLINHFKDMIDENV